MLLVKLKQRELNNRYNKTIHTCKEWDLGGRVLKYYNSTPQFTTDWYSRRLVASHLSHWLTGHFNSSVAPQRQAVAVTLCVYLICGAHLLKVTKTAGGQPQSSPSIVDTGVFWWTAIVHDGKNNGTLISIRGTMEEHNHSSFSTDLFRFKAPT